MSTLIPFESIRVGEELGLVDDLVSEAAVRQYCEDFSDANPWYSGPSPFGGPIAPPAFLAGLTSFRLLATRFNSRATIGARTAHRNLAPLPVGQRMTTKGKIADKYVKRGLEYVVITSTSYGEDGTAVRESTDHILLSLERTEAAADGRPADPAADLPGSYQLPGLEKTIFQRALAEREFSPDSIHNDGYTKQHGYPGALISAYVLSGYMSEPMVEFFGSSWLTSGEISLRFVSPGVQQGDRVTCGASVRETTVPGAGEPPRVVLDVWMEKAGGTRPVLGTASAILER